MFNYPSTFKFVNDYSQPYLKYHKNSVHENLNFFNMKQIKYKFFIMQKLKIKVTEI